MRTYLYIFHSSHSPIHKFIWQKTAAPPSEQRNKSSAAKEARLPGLAPATRTSHLPLQFATRPFVIIISRPGPAQAARARFIPLDSRRAFGEGARRWSAGAEWRKGGAARVQLETSLKRPRRHWRLAKLPRSHSKHARPRCFFPDSFLYLFPGSLYSRLRAPAVFFSAPSRLCARVSGRVLWFLILRTLFFGSSSFLLFGGKLSWLGYEWVEMPLALFYLNDCI